MLMLFICIAIGFTLRKTKVLPENAGKVLAKLVTWVFMPALNFSAMASRFNVPSIKEHASNIIFSALAVAMSITVALILSRLFVKEDTYERCVYKYGLSFGNCSYVGDPMALSLYGAAGLTFYKVACIPVSFMIYTWGGSILIPKDKQKKQVFFTKLLNAPMISLFAGAVVGITGLGELIFSAPAAAFAVKTLDALSACMGPSAMLVAGITIANYDFSKMIKNKKVYIATFLRLIIIPSIIIATVFGIKELANLAFELSIDNSVLFLLFFTVATPLGLNTVVFPEAYGGDPSTGASMAMISHSLCVITIPIMFALMTLIFGTPPVFI